MLTFLQTINIINLLLNMLKNTQVKNKFIIKYDKDDGISYFVREGQMYLGWKRSPKYKG